MEYSKVKTYNPRLFWDGICRGEIPYSEANALSTGPSAQTPLVENILGGPYAPIVAAFDPNGNSIPIGASDEYPKPWRSAGQRLQDGSYGSQIGPFARLVKLPDSPVVFENTCANGNTPPQCGGSLGGIYGRIGLSSNGVLAFRAQPWYNQEEGTYNTAYWNNQYGIEWITWKQWWDSASKATITCEWEDIFGNPLVQVEVAYSIPDLGDATYWPGPSLGAVGDASYDLLVAMVGIAVAVRWIL